MTPEDIFVREKSSTKKCLIFGLPNLGANIVMGFADFALFALYNLGYNITPFLVGIALGLGKITIAASQFFFGWISDAKYTKWGRRKPYLLTMSPILGLSFIFLLLPGLILDLKDLNTIFIWLLVWYQIFNISYGVTSPYGAWMAEQFRFNDRPRASQYQQLFGFIGYAVITAFSMVVLTDFIDNLELNPGIIPIDFVYYVLIFGIIPIVLFYLTSILISKEPHFKIDSNIIQNLKSILKNRNFLLATVMQGISSIATIMIVEIMLIFIIDVLHFNDLDYYIAAGIMIFGILIFLYIWKRVIEKLGKKRSLLYIFLSAIIILSLTLIGLIPSESHFIFGLLFIIGLAGCLGGWDLFPAIIYADIAEDDEKITEELKAGIYTGFPSITLNLFQAFGIFLTGSILELPSVGGLSYSIGLILWGPICSLIFIITYLFTKKFIQLDFEWERFQ